ncbi:recombinase RecT [Sphingopyxis flava]|uniref:Recombination protein RecT n=1 Tax=Sphingopyxis flava TaxID=1507287 RepID=A0A1T5ACU9_9SPHN|nr:recombinase RecT [Sphingopyxis flava]SKB32804.1 recombination protein RecT [Sphingopyxis flava]
MNAQTQVAPRDPEQTAVRAPDPQTPAGLAYQLEKGARELRKALPSHIDPEKFQRTIITAVQANPELLRADRQSLLLSVMKAAQDGLLPDGREAALVIFNNRVNQGGNWVTVKTVQYMPMVYGLRKKILQSGEIRDITAKVVYRAEYERGTFLYEEGTERMLRHKPDLLLSDEEATDENIVAAYSIATYMDGTMSYEVMSRAEINKVRQVSKTGALGMVDRRTKKPIEPKGPWVDWFGEMAKKTVMRRHAKTLPMSGDLLDVEGREDDDALLAESTGRVLSVEADEPEPVALPSADELSEGEEDGDPTDHDPDTGEVIEQGKGDDAPAEEKSEQKPKGEGKGGKPDKAPDPEPEPSGENNDGPSLADELVHRFDTATTAVDLKAVHADWLRHVQGLSDFDNDRCDAAHLEAKDRLGVK